MTPYGHAVIVQDPVEYPTVVTRRLLEAAAAMHALRQAGLSVRVQDLADEVEYLEQCLRLASMRGAPEGIARWFDVVIEDGDVATVNSRWLLGALLDAQPFVPTMVERGALVPLVTWCAELLFDEAVEGRGCDAARIQGEQPLTVAITEGYVFWRWHLTASQLAAIREHYVMRTANTWLRGDGMGTTPWMLMQSTACLVAGGVTLDFGGQRLPWDGMSSPELLKSKAMRALRREFGGRGDSRVTVQWGVTEDGLSCVRLSPYAYYADVELVDDHDGWWLYFDDGAGGDVIRAPDELVEALTALADQAYGLGCGAVLTTDVSEVGRGAVAQFRAMGLTSPSP